MTERCRLGTSTRNRLRSIRDRNTEHCQPGDRQRQRWALRRSCPEFEPAVKKVEKIDDFIVVHSSTTTTTTLAPPVVAVEPTPDPAALTAAYPLVAQLRLLPHRPQPSLHPVQRHQHRHPHRPRLPHRHRLTTGHQPRHRTGTDSDADSDATSPTGSGACFGDNRRSINSQRRLHRRNARARRRLIHDPFGSARMSM